jgi:hypothetical protein
VKKREGREGSGSVRGHAEKGGGQCGPVGQSTQWTGIDAVALGCSDSGGWHTPHGRGRHGVGVTDTRDQGEAVPGGSDRGVKERKKEREAGWQGAPTCGPGRHSAGRRGSNSN